MNNNTFIDFFVKLISKLKYISINYLYPILVYIFKWLLWALSWILYWIVFLINYAAYIVEEYKIVRIGMCTILYGITLLDSVACYFWFNEAYGFTACTMLVIDLYAACLYCLCIVSILNKDDHGFCILAAIISLSALYLYYVTVPLATTYLLFKFLVYLVVSYLLFNIPYYFLYG